MTRLMDTSTEIAMGPDDQNHIAFQHTVFCQTAMPYRNPGDVRRWERRNGRVFLQIEAGSALDPVLSEFVDLPLPFGAKARLILVHLNSEALRTGSAIIEVEDSLTAFVKRLLNRNPSGPQVKAIKAQLAALSTALIRLGMTDGHRSVQVSTQIIEAFDLWAPTAANQRVLWPSTIQLGARYFVNLTRHAVPLDERAVAALSHSAMGLDVYSWLAQRQHRVPRGRPQFIPWTALHQQFGLGYNRLRKFREKFMLTLALVHTQYPAARIEADQRGLTLRNSPPPVTPRSTPLPRKG